MCIIDGSLKDLAAHSGRITTDILTVNTGYGDRTKYDNLILVGNTCLEKDVITNINECDLTVGDLIVLPYCGAYSIVMRPQFIHYMPPIYSMVKCRTGDMTPIKPRENINDIFGRYTSMN